MSVRAPMTAPNPAVMATISAAPSCRKTQSGLCRLWWRANRRRNRTEESVKLTDVQLRLLGAASQRDDGALKLPSHLTGGAACKVVAKLLAEGHIEVKPRC